MDLGLVRASVEMSAQITDHEMMKWEENEAQERMSKLIHSTHRLQAVIASRGKILY